MGIVQHSNLKALNLTPIVAMNEPNKNLDVDEKINKLMCEFLRVSKKVIFTVPSYYFPKKDFGNERLMKKEEWESILNKFKVVKSVYFNYQPAWHSKIRRIKEIIFKILFNKKIEKPWFILIRVSD